MQPATSVLILGKGFPPDRGGIESHVGALAIVLAADRPVTALVYGEGPRTRIETIDGVVVVRCATFGSVMSQPISPAYLWRALTTRAGVVHLHVPNVLGTLAALLRPSGISLLVTHHADIMGREPFRSVVMALYRRVLARARRVVFTADANRRHSVDARGVRDEQVAILPLHAEVDPAMRGPDVVALGRDWRHQRCGTAPLAVFVGRLVPYKGLDVLVTALSRTPDLHVAIIGEGPLRAAVEAWAAAAGVADRLHLVGAADERLKHALLSAGDCLVLPSTTVAEAFGIVQAEAMMWGKPVVTTNLPSGVPEVGVPDVTALIVEPGDSDALAAALRRLIADPALAHRLGEAGRQRAEERYTPASFARNVRALYLGLDATAPRDASSPAR